MTDLPTLIAELEEALKAATPGPWRQGQPDMTKVHPDWVDADGNSSEDCFHRNGFAKTIAVCKDPDFDIYDARLIALMRTHLPTLIEAARQKEELLQVFEAQWGAEMRAKQRWQIETGKEGTWPDRANLVVWLMERVEKMEASLKRQGEALEKIANPQPHSRNLPSCCQYTFDDTCELFSETARAALSAHKEKSDV